MYKKFYPRKRRKTVVWEKQRYKKPEITPREQNK